MALRGRRCLLLALALAAVFLSPVCLRADGSYSFLNTWGQALFDSQLRFPTDMAIDSSGNVYVLDTNNHRVQKFTRSGDFITKWGSPGNALGQFLYPSGITVDGANNVWVALPRSW